jgi:hypothetical protein
MREWDHIGDSGSSGSTNTFQKLAGKLIHASFDTPGGNGLLSPIYHAMKGDPKFVTLTPYLKQTLSDWRYLLRAMTTNPAHVKQLVTNYPDYIGYVDACKKGVEGIWQHGQSELEYHVWQLQWPSDIQQNIKTFENPTGTLTINDLELAGTLLHWLVLEQVTSTLKHKHIAMYCDNISTVSWAYKMAQSKSVIAGFLL